MSKKVLLFMSEQDLKPSGGPAGYLYNVKTVMDSKKIENVNFISNDNIPVVQETRVKDIIKRMLPDRLKRFLYIYSLLYKDRSGSYFDFQEYKAVHFHTTYSLYMNRFNLDNYSGKVILTSHSPKPAHREIIEDQFSNYERIIHRRKLSKIKKIDEYAFKRADYIIFPCEEAEEPYYNNWDEYDLLKKVQKNKYKYVPTGCNQCIAKEQSENIRKKYGIPLNSFIISYAGRHNETKGYDILKKLGEEVIKRYDNVFFLIAGKEGPLMRLESKKWIEVGWTNDPHSLIAASDLFVLPNRETYFDLIMLEVLSLGKMVLASNTGGNKYFNKFKEKGIFYFDSLEDAIKQVDKLIELKSKEKEKFEKLNRDIYTSNFTMEIFIEKYMEILNEIIEE